jgi:hypothetical protein
MHKMDQIFVYYIKHYAYILGLSFDLINIYIYNPFIQGSTQLNSVELSRIAWFISKN